MQGKKLRNLLKESKINLSNYDGKMHFNHEMACKVYRTLAIKNPCCKNLTQKNIHFKNKNKNQILPFFQSNQ